MNFNDHDPRYDYVNDSVDGTTDKNNKDKEVGRTSLVTSIELIPYDGSEQTAVFNRVSPTFDIDHAWHNRPA